MCHFICQPIHIQIAMSALTRVIGCNVGQLSQRTPSPHSEQIASTNSCSMVLTKAIHILGRRLIGRLPSNLANKCLRRRITVIRCTWPYQRTIALLLLSVPLIARMFLIVPMGMLSGHWGQRLMPLICLRTHSASYQPLLNLLIRDPTLGLIQQGGTKNCVVNSQHLP